MSHPSNPSNENLELFASCLAGLERPLAEELKRLGIRRVRPLGGGVAFFCDVEGALKACLWSRLAARVLLVAGRASARSADELYADVLAIPWERVVAEGATIAVQAHGTNDALRNTRFTSLKVKDAVCDRLRNVRGKRPDVDASAADASIDVRVRGGKATVSLDLSGASLYQRTYLSDDDGPDAALECALAAGALALAGWCAPLRADAMCMDPACGDGALVVEAAAAACDMAPGLARSRWGFEGWARFDEDAWDRLLEEADERFERGLQVFAAPGAPDASGAPSDRPNLDRVRFAGVCTSSPSIARARKRVRRAGLRQAASIEAGDAQSVDALVERVHAAASRAAGTPGGAGTACSAAASHGAGASGADASAGEGTPGAGAICLIASVLEAGERKPEARAQAEASAFVRAASVAPAGSTFAAVGGLDVEARFGVAPVVREQLGRDRVSAEALVFDERPVQRAVVMVPDSAGGAEHRVEVYDQNAEQFAARLHKTAKERRKWARREGVSCYRVYDADLPEYAVAIDVYTGAGQAAGNTYLHVAEYAPPSSVDAAKARRRFDDVLALAPVVLGVRPDHVFSKVRERDKGGGQYRGAGRRSYVTQVEERGHLLEVDLSGYLDTGIFLDHRITREMVGRMAAGKRFLNLFAYTGTATVHAAANGAAETTTVDLSQTYLDWARRNMELNGFSGPEHFYERADVMTWITETRRKPLRYDVIFVDPPTFSNSKAMGKRTWDVQRDHVELLIGVSRLLTEGGQAVFSCNLRSFKPDLEALAKYGVAMENVSADTIPHDFERNPRIHQCYLVRRS